MPVSEPTGSRSRSADDGCHRGCSGWRAPPLTRQLAAWLLLSALLHVTALLGLGPERAGYRTVAPSRLEIRIQEFPKAVVADPSPSTETVAGETASLQPDSLDADGPASADTPETSPVVELPLPAHDLFFRSSELDQQPYPLIAVVPAYPPHARANEIEGWVRLLLLIDEGGQLRRLEVLEASPPGVFEDAALTAFAVAPFSPGRRAGAAVKSRMIIKVEFKSQDLQSARRE